MEKWKLLAFRLTLWNETTWLFPHNRHSAQKSTPLLHWIWRQNISHRDVTRGGLYPQHLLNRLSAYAAGLAVSQCAIGCKSDSSEKRSDFGYLWLSSFALRINKAEIWTWEIPARHSEQQTLRAFAIVRNYIHAKRNCSRETSAFFLHDDPVFTENFLLVNLKS